MLPSFLYYRTYNVSNILVFSPTPRGLLYAAATFLPVASMRHEKMYYDARFVHEDDLYHRLLKLGAFVVLGTAVLHIRSGTSTHC